MPSYTPHQRQILGLAANVSRNAPQQARRALIEALLVESGARNLSYGDRDSVGVLQQRPSQGWGPASETPRQDMRQFLRRAVPLARSGRYATAGQLAQAVQRSAFPERYDQRKAEAVNWLRQSRGAAGVAGAGAFALGAAPAQPSQPMLDPQTNAILKQLAGVVGIPYTLGALAGPAAPRARPKVKGFKVRYGGNATPRAKNIVALAREYLGTPYVWGGEKPGGFDCSGFVQYLYGQQGVQLPRTTYEQWKVGTPLNKNQLQPGDAVFFRPGPRGPEHMGMYIGGGKFIQAPKRGDVVKISSLNSSYYKQSYMGARRYGDS